MLLSEHHQEIELDLLKMGLDLLDFWRGTLSPRRLILILQRLPADSYLGQAIDPDRAFLESWRTSDHLIAHLADMYARVNFKDPKPLPRPADQIEAARRLAALKAQAERNRLRDLAELGA